MTDWQTAPAADGPKLMAWVDENLLPGTLVINDSSLDRRAREWRKGSRATVGAVDRMLTYFGHHVSELPDDVWMTTTHCPKGEGRRPKIRAPVSIAPRLCANCGDPIERLKPSGYTYTPSCYAKRKFCSVSCGHEAQAGTGRARSPEFNARLLSREEPFETATEDDPVRGKRVA